MTTCAEVSRRASASATAPSRRRFRLYVLTGREPWRDRAEPDTSPAMADFTEDALALCVHSIGTYEFWIVKKDGAKGIRGPRSARLTGRVVSADSPEEVVEAMRQLRDL